MAKGKHKLVVKGGAMEHHGKKKGRGKRRGKKGGRRKR
jgi:hypothetical protein